MKNLTILQSIQYLWPFPMAYHINYVKLFYNKLQIIDLSADFRLDDIEIYKKNYNEQHSAPNLLNEFQYGLVEINRNFLVNKRI